MGSVPAQEVSSSKGFEDLSRRAVSARDADHLDEAIVLFKKALVLRPSWQDGWWALGTLQYDKDQYVPASRAFQRLLALKPSNGTAHAMLGLCQFELGQDAVALKNLLTADEFGVANDQQVRKVALFHIGLLELRTRKYSAARETLGKLAADKIDTPELTMALGQAALLLTPQATPAAGSPEASTVEKVGRAESLLARKDFAGGRESYSEAEKQSPDFPNLHLAFGRFLLDARESEEAVREFQYELDRDPKNVNALLEMATAHYQSDSKEGVKYAERAAKLAPGIPFAHYILGLLRLDAGDAPGSIPELEIANKAFPREASVYFSLGKAYAKVGRKADAARTRAAFARLEKGADSKGPTSYGNPQTLRLDSGAGSSDSGNERPPN